MISKQWMRKKALYLSIILVTLCFLLAGGVYANARWVEYRDQAEHHALLHASSIAAALNGEQLASFFTGSKIPSTMDLAKFKTRMLEVIKANAMFHYIGLYTISDDDLFPLVDSSSMLTVLDIPQQLLQDEADRVFASQKPLLSPVFQSNQRSYTLVLAPMHDLQTQAIYGVLVIALDAQQLYDSPLLNTFRQIMIIFISWLCLLISVLMYRLYKKSQAMRKDLEANNQQLLQTDAEMQLLVDQMPQALAVHELLCDEQGNGIDYRFLKVNPMFTKFTGFSEEQLIGRRVLEVLPKTESYWIETYARVALTGKPEVLEHYSLQFDRWFLVHAYSPKRGQFITIFEDVTEQRARQKELEFLSFHDAYTRMYNRNAFLFHFSEYDKRKMHPLAIVLLDINGLKDINDTYGFDVGDRMIQQLGTCIQKHCVSDTWIAARIDGDMFGILIPHAGKDEIDTLVASIQNNCKQWNKGGIPISVSFGCAIKDDEGLGFEAVLRKAEDDLFEHKIAEHASSRQQTIEILLQSLFSKCPRERAHSSRVSIICTYIARELHLTHEQIESIKVAGIMHDIGKIAIDDSILNKPDKLDDQQWAQMKRHPEVGYHLLSSVTRYADFAKDILAHHERWDGKGYPRGLKQEQIPLNSRIIAVADAYDAMTYKRPYREPMSHQQACEEIKRCSATQFDPKIVEAFLSCAATLPSS